MNLFKGRKKRSFWRACERSFNQRGEFCQKTSRDLAEMNSESGREEIAGRFSRPAWYFFYPIRRGGEALECTRIPPQQ